jgi:pimeloyl-ACP methyl ester carboxylesterase
VLLYGNLASFVPEAEQAPLRDALRAWLHEDRPTAMRLSAALTGRSAELFHLVEQQKLVTIAPQLRASIEQNRDQLSPLSPRDRLKSIEVPVYLLHGAHDSVIPPSEALFAGIELRGHPHSVLVTPLIEHVEVSRKADLLEQLALVQFMSHLF